MPNITRLETPSANLENLTNLNIIVGRNGAGKSRFLRTLSNNCGDEARYKVSYITPERAGAFEPEVSNEANILQSAGYLKNSRSSNQSASFKNTSSYLLRQLELIFLRRMQGDPVLRRSHDRTFSSE